MEGYTKDTPRCTKMHDKTPGISTTTLEIKDNG